MALKDVKQKIGLNDVKQRIGKVIKKKKQRNLAVFVDGPNILRKELGIGLESIKEVLEKYGNLKIARVFLNQFASNKLVEAVVNQGFETVLTVGDVDVAMASDATEAIFNKGIHAIAFVTRDSDFLPAIMKAKRYGKETIVVLAEESSAAALKNTADVVIVLGAWKNVDRKGGWSNGIQSRAALREGGREMNIPVGSVEAQHVPFSESEPFAKIAQLMKEGFNGYLVATAEGVSGLEEGILMISDASIIGVVFDGLRVNKQLYGVSALRLVLNLLKAGQGIFDVNRLSRQQIDLIMAFNEKIKLEKAVDSATLSKLKPKAYEPEIVSKELLVEEATPESKNKLLKKFGLGSI